MTLAVVDAGAFSGCCALHAVAPVNVDDAGNGAGDVLWAEKDWAPEGVPPLGSGTFAIRLRVKLLSADPITYLLRLTGPDSSIQLGVNGGNFLVWEASSEYPDMTQWGSTVPFPTDHAWHCLEVVVNVAKENGVATVFLDDQTSPVLVTPAGTSTDTDGGWTGLQFGLPYTAGAVATEVYYDDVVAKLFDDAKPGIHIGCR
jgi:hypothetical protein